jgi:hypothetical protein
MFKILCTGNPKDIGIAMEIQKLFPSATFVSRSNGYDLNTNEGLEKFNNLIVNYNVLINNSFVNSNNQETLLLMARKQWISGHVFNIGSFAEYSKWKTIYPIKHMEKNKLKELGLKITDENFKVTHITVGVFQSSAKTNTLLSMDPKNIANTIKWIMELKFQVPIIGIEQITDSIRDYYNSNREK